MNPADPYQYSKWQVTWCYEKVQNDAQDFDNLYCTGNTIIMVLSGINIFVFAYLLYLHVRMHWNNTTFLKICLKVKTSILALILIYEILVFFRYNLLFEKQQGDLLYDFILVS